MEISMEATIRLKILRFAAGLIMAALAVAVPPSDAAGPGEQARRAEVRALAKEAFLYGYATVDSYNVLHNYALDPASSEHKGPLNSIGHVRDTGSPRNKTIGSSMLADLKRDPDNGITLLVQHDAPDPEWQSNWLPVQPGPFGLTFRTYLPRLPIRTGEWRAPPVVRLPN